METMIFAPTTPKKYMLKIPVQKRSRETVSSIIDSCSKLLVSDQYNAITTDRIAEMAGVSIGSLYQFFANKEAIVAAVIDDLLEKDIQYMREGFKTLPLDMDARVRSIIDLGFARFHVNRELRTALQNVQGLLDYWETRKVFFEVYQKLILEHVPFIEGRDRELMALIIVSTFNSALQLSLMKNTYTPEQEMKLKSEIYVLITRYIKA
ncbi:MAG: TetR/AcrR family transcriptional regulator [Bdellovibrionia bacterium]